jgi:large subunit ribosomal protein L27
MLLLTLDLQFFASKKGVGSTKNGRDSESKRLGAKRADGIVKFERMGRDKKKVSVYPVGQEA